MAQHKWHKEIKAWADGAEIEIRVNTETLGCDWTAIKQDHDWTPAEGVEYRIKLQPKEPQYLYVYDTEEGIKLGTVGSAVPIKNLNGAYSLIGRIKLEE
jgi:hypothetical protein